MVTCIKCNPPRILKNNASLRTHSRTFHSMDTDKLNTIAIVYPSRKHPLSNGPDIRKRSNINEILHSTSGESSDSDSSMDSSDDESETKKPRWVKLPVVNKTPTYNRKPRENRKRMYVPDTDEEDVGIREFEISLNQAVLI